MEDRLPLLYMESKRAINMNISRMKANSNGKSTRQTGLTLSLVGGFAALTIFAWLSAELLRKLIGPLGTALLDAPIVQYQAAHRITWLTSAMKAISTVGSDLYLWIAVLIGGVILARFTRSWRPLMLLALIMVGAVSLNRLIKLAVARTRPPSPFWAIPAHDWSFPSGHATESTAVYRTLARMFASTQTRSGFKIITYASGITVPFLVGVSRVYLGVHWPTDVISGWALGCMWSAIVLASSSTVHEIHWRSVGMHDRGKAEGG